MKHNWEELYFITAADATDFRVATWGPKDDATAERDIERCIVCGTIRITKMNGTHIYFKPGCAGQDRRHSPIWIEPKCVEEKNT